MIITREQICAAIPAVRKDLVENRNWGQGAFESEITGQRCFLGSFRKHILGSAIFVGPAGSYPGSYWAAVDEAVSWFFFESGRHYSATEWNDRVASSIADVDAKLKEGEAKCSQESS